MLWLKQSTAITFQLGPFVDVTDGVTPEEGLATNMDNATTGIRVSKNGAASIDRNSATAPAHDDDGYYRVELSTTDTNTLGTLHVQYEELAVTLPAWKDFMVLSAAAYDFLFGAVALPVNVTAMAANVLTATAINADAITGAKIAPGAVAKGDQLTGLNDILATAVVSAGAINTSSGVVSTVGTLNALAVNVITSASINAAALTAAKFGAGAIDANALATDAVNEIRDALLPTQNVAFDDIKFLFVAASDGRTPVTGASGTAVTRSIDGGAFGAGTGTLAEIGNGIYQYDASMADMNGGKIMFRFTGTGGTPGAPDDTFVNIVTTGGV